MELSKLKLLFEAGDLKRAEAAESPLESSEEKRRWILLITRKNASQVILSLKGGKSDRVFNSLDAVYNTAREIGFREITVSAQ